MKRQQNTKSRTIECVDLFCGAGGLTHGLFKQGITVKAGIDLDAACRYPYEQNNGGAQFIERDVTVIESKEVDDLFDDEAVRVLAGCAPCQPFSTYRQGHNTKNDSKWGLLYEFSRLVDGVGPDIVTMENVPSVAKHEVFADFVAELSSRDYHVWFDVVDCLDYGLAQTRRRMVLLASKYGPIRLYKSSRVKAKTVRDVIGNLPKIAAGESANDDPMHTASTLSGLNMKRIRASKPGGTWRDWPQQLIAECHRHDSGKTYPGVYGRMEWDKPAPTMTTQCYGFGNGRFGHPEQDRAISLREAALLQGFPKGYRFIAPGERVNIKALGRLVGNAVPVTLGKAIGRSIVEHVRQRCSDRKR